jgi:hypothetical protein
MIAILPVSLWADDVSAAMLRSNGVGVFVNKNPASPSNALFSDDLIETQKTAIARIEASGSTADINPETMVQFEGTELVLDHGSLSVNTSRGLRVRVGCITVTPANDAQWTHYDVVDVDGKVTVSALKNDVNIDARSSSPQQAKQSGQSNRVTVREGEQKSREEKCGAAVIRESVRLSGIGAIMNSPWAIGTGIAAIGVLTCFGLLCRNDDPVSPIRP